MNTKPASLPGRPYKIVRKSIVQADAIGCHVITVTHELLGKLRLLGRDLSEYSLETVRMLHRDAVCAGYSCISEYAAPSQ